MFRNFLIANRGEIACRIIRTCKEMGIRTVAVHSRPTATRCTSASPTTPSASAAPTSAQSYLNIPAVIAAAEITNVEAIHPGYGFLAEIGLLRRDLRGVQHQVHRPAARTPSDDGRQGRGAAHDDGGRPARPARKLRACSTTRKRPSDRARGRLPRHHQGLGRRRRPWHAHRSRRGEFRPAMRTASTRGRRRLQERRRLHREVHRAPRHIEIQVLADEHGNCIHLGERDCSIQRRHQKLIEESPSPVLTPELRERMGTRGGRGVPPGRLFLRRHHRVPARRGIGPRRQFRLSMDPADQRWTYFVTPSTVTGRVGSLLDVWVRYTNPRALLPVYYPDEALLIKAEALARTDQLAAAQAAVDSVRTDCTGGRGLDDPKACLPPLSGSLSQAQLLTEIYMQRRYELFGTGLRWEDARRRNAIRGFAVFPNVPVEGQRCWLPYAIGDRNANPNVPADPAEPTRSRRAARQ